MVATELGFRQMLPRKRDSLVHEGPLLAPESKAKPQTNGVKLTVPRLDISRSASPVLEPMSARLADGEIKTFRSMDDLEDSPTTRMSARVVG